MITYVNTVLVSNLSANSVFAPAQGHENPMIDLANNINDAGKFVVVTLDEKPAKVTENNVEKDDPAFPYVSAATANLYNTIKVGVVTDKMATQVDYKTGNTTKMPIVKWSNKISVDSIKSFSNSDYAADTEDTITIDFSGIDDSVLSVFAQGGKRIIVRLTFKDMPHRYRKWTESYEYITKFDALADPTAKANYIKAIVADIVAMINRDYKRARVAASIDNNTNVKLVALPYDDDDAVDSLSWANKVRFNANIYYTDPTAEEWASTNKYFPTGVQIDKVHGETYVASAKLVRDREAGAMGYQGILNRGEGTWPIIKPEMQTKLDGQYNAITLEFERMYRTADDLQRKTKECVEIYTQAPIKSTDQTTNHTDFLGIAKILDEFINA